MPAWNNSFDILEFNFAASKYSGNKVQKFKAYLSAFFLLFIIYYLWKVNLMCFELGRGSKLISQSSFNSNFIFLFKVLMRLQKLKKVRWATFCERYMRFLWVYAFSNVKFRYSEVK